MRPGSRLTAPRRYGAQRGCRKRRDDMPSPAPGDESDGHLGAPHPQGAAGSDCVTFTRGRQAPGGFYTHRCTFASVPDVGLIQRSAYAPFQSSRPHRALAEGFSHQFSIPDLRRRVSAASTAATVPVVSESRTGLGASPRIRRARGDGIPPMAIENLFRYPALAVGLKPSASQGEARPRGLWRNNYSKTIRASSSAA